MGSGQSGMGGLRSKRSAGKGCGRRRSRGEVRVEGFGFQELGQGLAGAVEAGFDGAGGQVQKLGDFTVAEIFQFAKDQDLAVLGGEFLEQLSQVQAGVGGMGEGAVRRVGGLGVLSAKEIQRQDAAEALITAPSGGLAKENLGQPGFDGGLGSEAFEIHEGALESFLKEVLGVGFLAGQRQGQPPEPGGVLLHQLHKGLVVALLGAGQNRISRDLAWFFRHGPLAASGRVREPFGRSGTLSGAGEGRGKATGQ